MRLQARLRSCRDQSIRRDFLAVRDALLALEDADRRPFARLFEAMQDARPDLELPSIALLRAIAKLDDVDLLRLGRWRRR